MSYGAASDVAAYTPELLGDSDNFTKSTLPTKSVVERFLSAGCSLIEGRLKAHGYSVPVDGNAAVYDFVKDLEVLYAAGRAEMVRMSSRIAPGERSRSQLFMDQFNTGMDQLMKMDLDRAGVGYTSPLYAGGISQSDKDSYEDDSDRVPSRFKRGQFRHSGTTRPAGVTTDETTE